MAAAVAIIIGLVAGIASAGLLWQYAGWVRMKVRASALGSTNPATEGALTRAGLIPFIVVPTLVLITARNSLASDDLTAFHLAYAASAATYLIAVLVRKWRNG